MSCNFVQVIDLSHPLPFLLTLLTPTAASPSLLASPHLAGGRRSFLQKLAPTRILRTRTTFVSFQGICQRKDTGVGCKELPYI
ncbi:hypothetical protein ACOSQ2_012654 [Xanthoceras sorbifolium]